MSVDQCQARPRAGRRWAREDLLCASAANSVVIHCGVEIPVCRIHGKAYARSGVEAAGNAASLWGWRTTG